MIKSSSGLADIPARLPHSDGRSVRSVVTFCHCPVGMAAPPALFGLPACPFAAPAALLLPFPVGQEVTNVQPAWVHRTSAASTPTSARATRLIFCRIPRSTGKVHAKSGGTVFVEGEL